ncbi:NAD(P)/FAD-dependent oxidoreductase [Sciscionella sediminilitoris]|uniref:NAD(P)/FAD-dependent oxidoreductase n=1 Tax=Sciscionella sediminilitoris TaxID=1445613 RepID=UPI000568EE31|nr:FAD-dependent oxidoreductase [Sciscionella sp. SE31]
MVLIIGAGHAGVEAADALRRAGHTGSVTLVDGAACPPYQRPPLSKDVVRPGTDPAPLPLRANGFYAEQGIETRFGSPVEAIETEHRTVHLADGTVLGYRTLILATGARARRIGLPGARLAGVHRLHTLADAGRLRAALEHASRVVVLGAGFIGMEFASAAAERGLPVTVLDRAERPMQRVLSVPMSERFRREHEAAGARLCFGTEPAAFEGTGGRVTAVLDTNGQRHPADLVVLGIGVDPAVELAQAAGLPVADGVVVDELLRTADERVYAIGDCAAFPCPRTGGRIRLEAVQNATDQARCVARTITGNAQPYTAVPWFWTVQCGWKLQIAGLPVPGARTVPLGDPGTGKGSLLGFARDRLVSVESLGSPAEHLAARKLLAAGTPVSPEQVHRPGFTLKALAAGGISH